MAGDDLMPGAGAIEIHDVQGLLVSGYGHLECSCYLLLQIVNAGDAKAWLGGVTDHVTTAACGRGSFALNIALTASGLRSIFKDCKLAEEVLQGFSFPFQEGMGEQHRARILGDVDKNAPEHWSWGAPGRDWIDILLLVYASDEVKLKTYVTQLQERFIASGIREIAALYAGRSHDSEHFGFADGISQPLIEGDRPFLKVADKARMRSGDAGQVKAGEFIIGYEDESGRIAPPSTLMVGGASTDNPKAVEIARNGSYLVFRELTQHVGRFRAFLKQSTLDANGEPDPNAAESLAAKMVGRWRNGAPLVTTDFADRHKESALNAFFYSEDPDGMKCPIGAHIRRANPRDSLDPNDRSGALERVRRRRLLRRGRSFGPPLPEDTEEDGRKRGLYFICLCSDIERQFEFVQQTWLNNPGFAGLSGEVDPLTGPRSLGSSFKIPRLPFPSRVCDLRQFVTVTGGAYFFLPGIKALRILATRNILKQSS